MALLAMEQFGLAIAERGGGRFEAVSGVRDIELAAGRRAAARLAAVGAGAQRAVDPAMIGP